MVIELYEAEAYVYHQINPLSILVRYSLRTSIVVEVQLKVTGGVGIHATQPENFVEGEASSTGLCINRDLY